MAADVISFAALAFVLAALRWDPNVSPFPAGVVHDVLLWTQMNSPLLLIVFFLVSYASRLRKYITPPTTWKKIHSLLDELQQLLFKEENDRAEPLHHHRVTLFKRGWCYRMRRWPWSGWLIPVERSGHMTRKTTAMFRAPDDPNMLEGVAGYTWARRAFVSIGELPDLYDMDGLDPNLQAKAIAGYARRTLVDQTWVRNRLLERRTLGRSFCGIPVEVSGGRLWGVIVVDSQTQEPKAGSQHEVSYRLIASVLGKLLEGG